jgi:predicted MFS family arabinose efflux permease
VGSRGSSVAIDLSALVPERDLPSALVAHSAGINISHAVGPALGGAIWAGLGTAAPFAAGAVLLTMLLAAILVLEA